MIVVDASVAAMWFVPEQHSRIAAQLLDSHHQLVAPDLLRLEVGSVMLKAVRRAVMDATMAREAMARLTEPALRLVSAVDYVDAAFALAQQHGCSIYDSVYLALAQSLDVAIVTNDVQMASVAKKAHIKAVRIDRGLGELALL